MQGKHYALLVIVDTSQPESIPTPGGLHLIRMITIDDTMPFTNLINSDAEVSLMSL
jgi:hypothetical protein